MEEQFKHGMHLLATFIEAGAGLIVLVAVLEALVGAFSAFTHRRDEEHLKDRVRVRLGRWLSLGLEFELAADVVLTAVSPNWNEIAKLGAIIVLRTLLNHFLQREIDQLERREREAE